MIGKEIAGANANGHNRNLFKENYLYLIGFAVLFIIGCVKRSMQEKGDLVLYFAKWRQPEVDLFFTYCTRMGEEWIYIASIILLLFVKFRYAILVPVLGFLVLLVSTSLKSYFATPRPRTYFYKLFDSNQIVSAEHIDLYVGYTSFPSGHSMSGFALFTFLALCISNRKIKAIMLTIASLIAFSRIVITQHFLEDILVGSLLGLLLAFVLFWIQDGRFSEPRYWFNGSLMPKKKDVA